MTIRTAAVLLLMAGCSGEIVQHGGSDAVAADAATMSDAPSAQDAADRADGATPVDSAMPADAGAAPDALAQDAAPDAPAQDAAPDAPAQDAAPPAVDAEAPVAGAYYVSEAGDDANAGTLAAPWRTIQKAADTVVAGDTVYIRAGTYDERVVVPTSGASGAFITFASYPGETAVIDGTGLDWGRSGALFDVSYRSYIRVRRLRVINSGWAGIGSPYGGCSNIVVEGCSTFRTQSSGINLSYGENIVIDGNSVDYANLLPWSSGGSDEAITVGATEVFEIKHNVVTNMGKEGIDAKGGANHGKIYGNRIESPPLMGIYIDAFGEAQHDIEIYGNTINDPHDGITLAVEYGGSLTDISVHDNVINNAHQGALCIAGYGDPPNPPMSRLTFDHNIVHGTHRQSGSIPSGISLANLGASAVTITNNTFGGTADSVPIRDAGGYVAAAYSIDGNALNQVVSGHPTGTSYTVIGNE